MAFSGRNVLPLIDGEAALGILVSRAPAMVVLDDHDVSGVASLNGRVPPAV
jgi:hypothetical protein